MPRGTASRTRINDMNSNSYTKAAMVALYLAFAAISCWATAESLHLLLPDWPQAAAWVVTIGFFVIASWGTKMITDSLNQNIYMEHRGLKLTGGIFIVLVFWLLCSMPTNTHTFFYRSHVREYVTQDVSATMGYLKQIKNKEHTNIEITKDTTKVRNEVVAKIKALEAEIMNANNPGDGPRSKEILSDIAALLASNNITPLTYRGISYQERLTLCKEYKNMIYAQLDARLKSIVSEHRSKDHTNSEKAGLLYKNLKEVDDAIQKQSIDLYDAETMQDVCYRLDAGYALIKECKDFVDFNNATDEENYTADSPQTKVRRLLSVYDVWVDFLTGKAGGLHFAFWIFISVLIDIAAFVFFDIAFKKED